MNPKESPQAIEMEKQLLSAMLMKEGLVVPDVTNIIEVDDLYRPEHRLVFKAILRLYAKGEPIDYLAVEEKLRKSGDLGKIDHLYLLHLIDATFTTAALSIMPTSSRKRLTSENLSNSATLSLTKLNAVSNRPLRFPSSSNNTLITLPVPPRLQKKLPSRTSLPTISILLSNK